MRFSDWWVTIIQPHEDPQLVWRVPPTPEDWARLRSILNELLPGGLDDT